MECLPAWEAAQNEGSAPSQGRGCRPDISDLHPGILVNTTTAEGGEQAIDQVKLQLLGLGTTKYKKSPRFFWV